MPYLGTQAAVGFSKTTKDRFSGDNSTTGFTMSQAANTATDIQVFVDNIRQEPTIAYSVSGATLTFTEAPPTGTNNVYVIHQHQALGTGPLPPQDLGSTDYIFGDDISFNSDGAVINFGLDSEVNLTHVHNTGLLLNSTSQLQFGDSGTHISQSADGVLDLVADSEIEINATTIDMNGAVDISGDITLGGEIVSAATISVTGGSALTLKSTDAGATAAPVFTLNRDSASPADNDLLGKIVFNGDNDAGETVDFATINLKAIDVSDGSEDGEFDISTMIAGTARSRIRADGSELIINENSVDVDFRIETNAVANAFLVDSSDDVILVGTTDTNPGNNTTDVGIAFKVDEGKISAAVSAAEVLVLNRMANDGDIILFRQAGTNEGYIRVDGSTVSYNGFSGQHETSGIPTNTPIGTVVSSIDELDIYPNTTDGATNPKAGQTRKDHPKVKVSNTVGDKTVYGVVTRFDEHDKAFVGSVGIGSVRVTGSCAKGDLLESNGDGTAKVQSDDIVKSSTIGKVTIGNSSTGVKLVSCVLYCG